MNIDELYAAYFNDIYRFVFSLTKNQSLTEDIVQETFTRAYLNLDNFRKKPNKAWLFTVSRHIFYDHLRTTKKEADVDYDFSTIPDANVSPEEKLFKKETIQKLYTEIGKLRESYQQALIYYYVEERSYKDAAIKMNVTETNFKSILFRAKKKLKHSLERKGDFLE